MSELINHVGRKTMQHRRKDINKIADLDNVFNYRYDRVLFLLFLIQLLCNFRKYACPSFNLPTNHLDKGIFIFA